MSDDARGYGGCRPSTALKPDRLLGRMRPTCVLRCGPLLHSSATVSHLPCPSVPSLHLTRILVLVLTPIHHLTLINVLTGLKHGVLLGCDASIRLRPSLAQSTSFQPRPQFPQPSALFHPDLHHFHTSTLKPALPHPRGRFVSTPSACLFVLPISNSSLPRRISISVQRRIFIYARL